MVPRCDCNTLRELKQTLPIIKQKRKRKRKKRRQREKKMFYAFIWWRGARSASFFRAPEMPQGPKNHTASVSPHISRWSESTLLRSSVAFRGYQISRWTANAHNRIRQLNRLTWSRARLTRITSISRHSRRHDTCRQTMISTIEEDVAWPMDPFLVRLALHCFRSYHFHPFARMKPIEKVFFSGVSVRLAACAANTWLPIFVLSWEIKFTLRNYRCIWGGRERGDKCEAPKSGSFICGTSEVRKGIVAFSKIRNFAGYYELFLFIRGDTGTRACECVCKCLRGGDRCEKKQIRIRMRKTRTDERETQEGRVYVCVCVCEYARKRKRQNAEVE